MLSVLRPEIQLDATYTVLATTAIVLMTVQIATTTVSHRSFSA